MQESEKEYSTRQRASDRSEYRDRDKSDEDMNRDENRGLPPLEPLPPLPHNGLLYALGIGIAGGLLTAIIGVIITLSNAATFQEAARLQDRMSLAIANTITGLNCLSYFLALLICFATGYVAGRVAVRRMFGFYAGALAGAVTYLGGIMTQYIPNYPGHIASTSSTGAVAGGILFLLIVLLFYAAIGGLMGLWGTSTATRKHPYYLARRAREAEEAGLS